ncbi:MAG: type ISP restriction/modification enzyme [Acidobacteriota bacterium]
MHPKFRPAVASFGADAKAKLSNLGAKGEPEDQLRAPLERLIEDFAEICGFPRKEIAAVGESSLSELKTRPDYAVTVRQTLVGFIEVKAPGKGADPRKFKDKHDKQQWEKLQSLPNLLYTDGNEFSLWHDGKLDGSIVRLTGDIETSGAELEAPASLQALFESFFQWQPIPPSSAKQLAELSARLCRFLRDEVTEQLALGSSALTALAVDWRKLLFPEATPEQFADGYAQAVTFGLLMARARDIKLSGGLDQVAKQLTQTHSLIGAALRLLTDDAENQATLKTSLGTLTRVLDAVHWATISKGKADAWLYFYEDFLAVYDNALRKKTGSYYTPPEVVGAMVQLVDEALRSRFSQHAGLASPAVTLADPAVGTGTFLLGVLRRIAETVEADEGSGSVPAAIKAAVQRLVGFEMQLGPFAVAQLRILAEIADLTGTVPAPARMFVTDTLSNPYVEEEWIPGILGTIAQSRREANKIKKLEPIMVVLGNPPYKEKAKGLGGWVETDSKNSPEPAPLNAWMPPADWGVGAHAKHLRNLYIYFWRWATWKVFDHDPKANTGIVCFITVAGFLNGPGFERMRDYLRRTAQEIWVIDCSPEGHQPEVNTRIFEGVQQPVCIVLASRPKGTKPDIPAAVHFRSLPAGHRQAKFEALKSLTLDGDGWVECLTDWRAPFLPAATGAWSTFPDLTDLFIYNGSGVMPGRTWVIAPDAESLQRRWQTLVNSPDTDKEALFHPHLRGGKLGDKHSQKVVKNGLPGYEARPKPVTSDHQPCVSPLRYGFRSFDRQWIIPDNRLINQPNPELWETHSQRQMYLTAFDAHSPTSGPALTFTGLIPDLHHYKGSFGGRVFPLWHDREARVPNIPPNLLAYLGQRYERQVSAEDLFAYIAAIAAHPAFTARFQSDLVQPGLRIPLTADADTFAAAAELGRAVIWLHTFGERFVDPKQGRPATPPRLPANAAPRIPAAGAIPQDAAAMPDTIEYDETNQRLKIGSGYVERVTPQMWSYEVSGKHVLRQWFSYRKANRERPIIGDRRPPSKLGEIQPSHWLAEYTTELINVLNVLGKLIELEPAQADLLERVCSGPTITIDELRAVDAFDIPASLNRKSGRKGVPEQESFF